SFAVHLPTEVVRVLEENVSDEDFALAKKRVAYLCRPQYSVDTLRVLAKGLSASILAQLENADDQVRVIDDCTVGGLNKTIGVVEKYRIHAMDEISATWKRRAAFLVTGVQMLDLKVSGFEDDTVPDPNLGYWWKGSVWVQDFSDVFEAAGRPANVVVVDGEPDMKPELVEEPGFVHVESLVNSGVASLGALAHSFGHAGQAINANEFSDWVRAKHATLDTVA
ncbi:unnamed protein product, partial [Effrenium voratum]